MSHKFMVTLSLQVFINEKSKKRRKLKTLLHFSTPLHNSPIPENEAHFQIRNLPFD